MNDKIGLFTHKRLALQYAYKHKLFKGIISIGAQVGIISEDFEGDKADLDETSDPAFSTAQLNGNGVDLALGAYYIRKQWYAGVSAQHINSPLIKLPIRPNRIPGAIKGAMKSIVSQNRCWYLRANSNMASSTPIKPP